MNSKEKRNRRKDSRRQVIPSVSKGIVGTGKRRIRNLRKPSTPRTGNLQLTDPRIPGPYDESRGVYNPQAARMLNVYHFIYRDSGYHFRPTKDDLIFFEWMGATNRLPKYLKWKTANLLARSTRSLDMVPCPFDTNSIPAMFDPYFDDRSLGLIHDNTFHKMKLYRRNDKRYVRFIFSLYQGKAASLKLDKWELAVAVKETVERLGTEKVPEDGICLPAGWFTSDDLEAEIVRTVKEVIPKQRERPGSFRVPTMGAEYFYPRSEGGALSALLGRLRYDFCPYQFLDTMYEGPDGAVEVYSVYDPEDIQLAHELSRASTRRSSEVLCRPVALAEPFKVRVITKGEGCYYDLARSYQPRIWSALAAHPTFQLVGQSMGPKAMRHFLSQIESEDDWIISGDYKQATDHIPSHLANLLYETVCARVGVPAEDVPALLRSLTGHSIDDGWNDNVEQLSGQLMGSPSSFPILCLYNAVLSRIAYEWSSPYKRIHKDLDEIPMLINGDDLLMGGSVNAFLTWKRVVNWGGLIPSVGKTLFSKDWGTINSQIFRFRRVNTHGCDHTTAEHVPHLQLQLALGWMRNRDINRETGRIRYGSPAADQVMNREFIDSCRHKERGWRFLFGSHREQIWANLKAHPRAALCLPVEAGGLGFPAPPENSEYYSRRLPTSFNLRVARMLLECPDREHSKLSQSWMNAIETGKKRSVLSWIKSTLDQAVGSRWMPLPLDDIPDYLAPTRLMCYSHMNGVIEDQQVRDAYLKLIRAERKYERSPWTYAEVCSFLRTKRWVCCYGRYL